jgi:putative endopeptidase
MKTAAISGLLTAFSLLATPTAGWAQQTTPPPEPGVDARVHPGDDFFAFANGAWLQATEIPAGRTRWRVGDEIRARAHEQVAALLREPGTGPIARPVADHRAAFLDQATIEARGIQPLLPLLKGIAALRNRSELARWLGSEMPADGDPMGFGAAQSSHPFGLAVDKGLDGEQLNTAFLVQGGLGLPDREHHLSSAAPMRALRGQYRAYLATLWAWSGRRAAPQRIDAVLALEAALARGHATREASANEDNARNVWRRADFARRAPGMDWAAFLSGAGLAHQEAIVVWQPSAATATAALVAARPLQVWQDYLHLRTIDRHAAVLPRAVADAATALQAAARGSAPQSRVQQADAAVQQALGESVSRLYAQAHFPPMHKARVDAIAAQVKAALRDRVASAAWLTPAGRQQAAAKLGAVHFGLGHPQPWPDDAGPQIQRDDAFGNQRRATAWHTRRTLARLGRPVDAQRWLLPAHEVGAGLVFTHNAYNFPAALLQPPKFDAAQPADPDAFNFGAIGAIVGHELTHFIDTLGAEYDAQGAKRRWWSAQDLARHEAATAPLVQQFSSYRPYADVALDGKAGLVENLADLMGLAAAFDAYRTTLANHPRKDDAAFVKQHDRLFFIGFARSWRARHSETSLRQQAATDHPPEPYRINTVRNLDAWYAAFDVGPGHRLWLEPKARVQPWAAP